MSDLTPVAACVGNLFVEFNECFFHFKQILTLIFSETSSKSSHTDSIKKTCKRMKYFKLKNGSLESPDLKNLQMFYAISPQAILKPLSKEYTSDGKLICDDDLR